MASFFHQIEIKTPILSQKKSSNEHGWFKNKIGWKNSGCSAY